MTSNSLEAGENQSVSSLVGARRIALRNWSDGAVAPRSHLIQLGWAHFVTLGAGLLIVLAAVSFLLGWDLGDFWVRSVLIPRIQAKYGFECGDVPVPRFGNAKLWAMTRVIPGGRLARLGLRDGDVPWEHLGTAWVVMYDALVDAERGRFARFDVVNAYDYAAGKNDGDLRTIVLNPPKTDPAKRFFGFESEWRSPTGERTLRTVRLQGGSVELWILDVATGGQTMLCAFDHEVGVVWSTDGRWVAASDRTANGRRCVLLDSSGGPPRDLSATLARHDEATRRQMQDNKDVDCDVFGWIRGTSRVALTVSALRADPQGFRQDFFYDVASGTVLPAR